MLRILFLMDFATWESSLDLQAIKVVLCNPLLSYGQKVTPQS